MKKCPFCAENIQDEAIKCRFCGEFIEDKKEIKWYFKTNILVLAFLMAGPLALPLLICNPNIKIQNKIIITSIVLLISYFLVIATVKSIKNISDSYSFINQLLQQ